MCSPETPLIPVEYAREFHGDSTVKRLACITGISITGETSNVSTVVHRWYAINGNKQYKAYRMNRQNIFSILY